MKENISFINNISSTNHLKDSSGCEETLTPVLVLCLVTSLHAWRRTMSTSHGRLEGNGLASPSHILQEENWGLLPQSECLHPLAWFPWQFSIDTTYVNARCISVRVSGGLTSADLFQYSLFISSPNFSSLFDFYLPELLIPLNWMVYFWFCPYMEQCLLFAHWLHVFWLSSFRYFATVGSQLSQMPI